MISLTSMTINIEVSDIISILALIVATCSAFYSYKQHILNQMIIEKNLMDHLEKYRYDVVDKLGEKITKENIKKIDVYLETLFNEYDNFAKEYYSGKLNKKRIKDYFEESIQSLFDDEMGEELISRKDEYQSLIDLALEWGILKIENSDEIIIIK